MRRRKYLAAVGSLAAGGAAMMGTGAFSTEASSNVSLDVVGAASAYLGVVGETNSEFVTQSSPVTIDLASGSDNGGSGLAEKTDTVIEPAFYLKNQSSETLYVEIGNPLSNNKINTSSVEAPAGVDVQFLTAPSTPLRNENIGLIGRNEEVEGQGNGLGGGFRVAGSNEYYFHHGQDDVQSNTPNRTSLTGKNGKAKAGALEIGSGGSFPVVFRVVVNEPGTGVDIDTDIDIEAHDSESQLTYDDTVNSVF